MDSHSCAGVARVESCFVFRKTKEKTYGTLPLEIPAPPGSFV